MKDIEISSRGSALGVLSLGWCGVVAVGCAAPVDAISGEIDDVNGMEQPLTGNVGTTNCTAPEQSFSENVVDIARFVARSRGLAECIDATMRSPQTLRSLGGVAPAGPYVPCSSDPFASSPLTTQVERAIFAARSTNDVRLTCTTERSAMGEALIGSYNTQNPESMKLHQPWRNFAASDNGANATREDWFQSSRQQAVNTVWHEGMHQWGYHHVPSPSCGSQRLPFESVPSIVGDCMQTIMHRTATITSVKPTVCTPTSSPTRRIMQYDSTSTDCVADPEFDVGVVLEAGQTCPTEELRVFMDDEDDGNENAATGWHGNIVSNSNTTFRFCRVDGGRFRPIPSSSASANYAVLRMGASCPAGSVAFSRTFDNEDDGNINAFSGHIRPSRSDSNTQLQFCMFRASASARPFTFPSIRSGLAYGVLAGASLPGALATGSVKTDDEDTGNENLLQGDSAGFSTFLTADSNTVLRFARVM